VGIPGRKNELLYGECTDRCIVKGCNNNARYPLLGLCNKHYIQKRKFGKVKEERDMSKNYVVLDDPNKEFGYDKGARFSIIEVEYMLENECFTIGTVLKCPKGRNKMVICSSGIQHLVMWKPVL